MVNPILSILFSIGIILVVVIMGTFVLVFSGFLGVVFQGLHLFRQLLKVPRRKPRLVQKSILDYCPHKSIFPSCPDETNPDADNDYSEEHGYESSAVQDSEDEGEE